MPPVLLGPFAGVPVDRLGPKRVLIAADAAAAGVALLFLFAGTFETLVLLAALDGVTKAFTEPAFQSLPPRLVGNDQLAAANGLLATASQSAIAFGLLLGAAAAVYVGTSNEVVAFGGIFGWGVVTAFFIAPFRTLMQRATPVEMHGRVFALDGTLHNLGDLVSLPLVGLTAAAAGVQVAGASMAVVPVVGGLATFWWARKHRALLPSNPGRDSGPDSDARVAPVAA